MQAGRAKGPGAEGRAWRRGGGTDGGESDTGKNQGIHTKALLSCGERGEGMKGSRPRRRRYRTSINYFLKIYTPFFLTKYSPFEVDTGMSADAGTDAGKDADTDAGTYTGPGLGPRRKRGHGAGHRAVHGLRLGDGGGL